MSNNKEKKKNTNKRVEFASSVAEASASKAQKMQMNTINEFSEESGQSKKDRSKNKEKDNIIRKLDFGRIGIIFAIVLVVVLTITVIIPSQVKAQYIPAYEVYLDEDTCLGIVGSMEQMDATYNQIFSDFGNYYGMDVSREYTLTYTPINVKPLHIYPVEQLDTIIRQNLDVGVLAWVVMINNAPAAVLESQEDAQWVMEQILAPYKEDAQVNNRTNIAFLENVEIVNMSIDYKRIMDRDTALSLLRYGGDIDIRRHTVVSGETLYSIAKHYDMRVADLLKANPDLAQSKKLYRNDILTIAKINNLVNVKYNESIHRNEYMEYETLIVTDDTMFETESRIQQHGVLGDRDITGIATYINGYEADIEISTEEILTEPVNQILIKGTREVPRTLKQAHSGDMMLPLKSFTITSSFGKRDTGIDGASRNHSGVDLAASYGTPIYASADGKVSFAGSSGGYGQMVRIKHDGGVETRYGHCSQLLVSSGQYVQKGDIIALVGSTGTSSGNHVHFEVRINGEPVDPMK